jgi:hypothetical protein
MANVSRTLQRIKEDLEPFLPEGKKKGSKAFSAPSSGNVSAIHIDRKDYF